MENGSEEERKKVCVYRQAAIITTATTKTSQITPRIL